METFKCTVISLIIRQVLAESRGCRQPSMGLLLQVIEGSSIFFTRERLENIVMMTSRQRDVYRFIQGFIEQHGYGPLLTEIAEGIGIQSKGTVHRYVTGLAAAGLIEIVAGRHRGIRLCRQDQPDQDKARQRVSLPLVGKIAAGRPIEAIAGDEHINLADFFMGPNRFVLKVQGDSMMEAGILDGDMVIVEKRNWADNGTVVVALIDRQEATLKRIRHNPDGTITLLPANQNLAPVTYSADRVSVQGVVVGQMRAYR